MMKICKLLCAGLPLVMTLTGAMSAGAVCLVNNTAHEMRYWYAPMNEGELKSLPAGQTFCDNDYSGTFQVSLLSSTPPLMASVEADKTDSIKVQGDFLVVIDKNGNSVAQSILAQPR